AHQTVAPLCADPLRTPFFDSQRRGDQSSRWRAACAKPSFRERILTPSLELTLYSCPSAAYCAACGPSIITLTLCGLDGGTRCVEGFPRSFAELHNTFSSRPRGAAANHGALGPWLAVAVNPRRWRQLIFRSR